MPQGTARHVRIRTGLPPEAASIPSPALSPFCSQVKKSATPPWFGKIQCFANAAVGSTNHVWQCFMHFPNVTVQNLRLCSPTKFCLWEQLLLWHLYYHTWYVSIILILTCSSLTQPFTLISKTPRSCVRQASLTQNRAQHCSQYEVHRINSSPLLLGLHFEQD